MIVFGLSVSCVDSIVTCLVKYRKEKRNTSKKDREVYEFQFCDRLVGVGSRVLT